MNRLERYLRQAKSMIPLMGSSSYRAPSYVTVRRITRRKSKSRRRKTRKGRKGKVRRNPRTGRFMKSK